MNLQYVSAVVCAALFAGGVVSAPSYASGGEKIKPAKFVVVADFESGSEVNDLGGASGPWTMNPDDKNAYCESKIVAMKGPEESTKCLRLAYSVESDKPAQCGYWSKLNTLDASKYDHLEFDIKGDDKEGCTTEFRLEIKKFKDIQKQTDKLTGMKTVKNVTKWWQHVSIPLTYFNGLYDKTQKSTWADPETSLKNLDEYVIVFHQKGVTKKKGAMYIDNIRFVKRGDRGPSVFDRPPQVPKDKACIILEDPAFKKEYLVPSSISSGTYDRQPVQEGTAAAIVEYLKARPGYRIAMSSGALEYMARVHESGNFGFLDHDNYMKFLVNRLRGFPSRTIVRKRFPRDDKEFLRTIARDTWAFFDNVIDKKHGLPLDTVALGKEEPAGEGCVIGDYTNVTNIGIYICSIVAAYDFGFITKDDAVSRLKLTLNTIKDLEVSKWGFLYNYYDTTWGVRTEYFISLVDSGWLAAGMYVAKNAFPQDVGPLCNVLIERGNFNFFYDPVEQQMWHGYYENMGDYVNYHYGIFYAEPRLTSFIAIGKGDVEEAHWFGMVRTFSKDYTWTTQEPKGRKLKEYKGIKYWGGWYQYGKYSFVPSWGGSMFEALMPALLIDEKSAAPKGLGLNDSVQVKAAIEYTSRQLKYPVWGMSPSSDPNGGYAEYGVKALGAAGYGAGAVTPHATFLALEYAPEEAVRNLRKMLAGWDIYGEYGFYDALDPFSKKVAYKYLSLDQGMILMALDNYLNDGALRKRFQADPVFQRARHLLESEDFFE